MDKKPSFLDANRWEKNNELLRKILVSLRKLGSPAAPFSAAKTMMLILLRGDE
jgi:hypothetical protein